MFGAALVVSGDRAVVGAPGVNGGKGVFVKCAFGPSCFKICL